MLWELNSQIFISKYAEILIRVNQLIQTRCLHSFNRFMMYTSVFYMSRSNGILTEHLRNSNKNIWKFQEDFSCMEI